MHHRPVGQGERSRVAELGGLRLTESWHAPDSRLDWHAHERGCATLILGGEMCEGFGARDERCAAGALLAKPAGVGHRTRFGSRGAHCLIIEPLGAQGVELDVLVRTYIDADLTQRIGSELTMRDPASGTVMAGLALQLLGLAQRTGAARRPDRRDPAWLRLARDRIHAEFRMHLTVAGLAASAGVHPDHLSRTFRRRYGCSVGATIRALRIAWAAEQLRTTDLGVSAISLAAGFYDQSHFTAVFRRQLGVPPGRYRAEHAGSDASHRGRIPPSEGAPAT